MRLGYPAIFCTVLALAAPSVPAQSTRPTTSAAVQADESWPAIVDSLARAAVEADTSVWSSYLQDDTLIRPFGSSAPSSVEGLFKQIGSARLIGPHVYAHPATTVASDLAADFQAATFVPEAARQRMVLDDAAQARRANLTAAQ